MVKNVLLYLMAFFYVYAGINHFRRPHFYRPMMPPIFPAHDFLIFASGFLEVLFGLLLLLPSTRALAAWGLIALLIAVFPANIYMLLTRGQGYHLPYWLLVVRIPFQAILIFWAYYYTKLN